MSGPPFLLMSELAVLSGKGLGHLSDLGGKGCVVLGDPSYYHRFGFETDAGLKLEGVPPEFFMRLVLLGPEPKGLVTYHKAFEAE